MAEAIKLSVDLPVFPERVYRAWLDGYEMSQITGSPAEIDAHVGGKYTAWDGYIVGQTLVMTPFSHIVQTWRTQDFPPGSPDLRVDIRLEPTCLGTQLVLEQTSLPDGQSKMYLEGWMKDYFRPMRDYFDALIGETPADMDG